MNLHRALAAATLAALLPAMVRGQTRLLPDSGRVIRAVELRRFNIFAPTEARGFFTRLANSLHWTTRAPVVRRELLFGAGQPYDSASVAETIRNLRAVGVFRLVKVDSVRTDSGLVVRVTTGDGWSTRPDFRFKSTGNSVVWTANFDELNFLGTATLVGIRYRKDPDRSTITTSFRQTRLLAGRVGLAMQYQDRTDGKTGFAELSKPFFSLSDRFSWRLDGDARRERVFRSFDGALNAQDTVERRYALGYATAAWALRASPGGYLRVGLSGQIRRDNYAAESRVDTLSKSISGAFGGYLLWRRARYFISQGILGFGRDEDVDFSTAVGFALNVTPKGFGYEADGLVPYLSFRTAIGRPTHFLELFATSSGRFTSAGLDSGSVHLAATAFFLPALHHLVVVHGASGWQQKPLPGTEFDLGLGLGPRAFRQHAFTGDRAFFTSAEYRWTMTEDFLKLSALGLAGFIDYGGAWYHGTPRRTGLDFGIGLRFGLIRTTNVETPRIDLAYRVKNDAQSAGWVIVFGRGFEFSFNGRLDH